MIVSPSSPVFTRHFALFLGFPSFGQGDFQDRHVLTLLSLLLCALLIQRFCFQMCCEKRCEINGESA